MRAHTLALFALALAGCRRAHQVTSADSGAAATAQFDGRWKGGGLLGRERQGYALARLPGAGAIVLGGLASGGEPTAPKRCSRETEVYDPGARAWSDGPPMHEARCNPMAVALGDGRVVVFGGISISPRNTALASTEIYDPRLREWRSVAPMSQPRFAAVAGSLADGRVVAAGGVDEAARAFTVVEVFDPRAETWSTAPELPPGRVYPDATGVVPAVGVVVGGGLRPCAEGESPPAWPARCRAATVDVAGTDGGVWGFDAPALTATFPASAVSGDEVIVAGGEGRASTGVDAVYALDPVARRTRTLHAMREPRFGHTLAPLGGGRLLAVGGRESAASSAEVYDRAADRWSVAAGPSTPRFRAKAVALDDGSILLVGGEWPTPAPKPTAEIFVPGR
jgi:Kelch motif